MISPDAQNLRGRDAVVTSAPFVWTGGERHFHEVPSILHVGAQVLLLSDTPTDDSEGHVRVLVRDAHVYLVSVDCLTIVQKYVPKLDVPIPPEVCANVVYLFDGRGTPPGSFFRKLAHAVIGADPGNRNRLALGFPEWVRAVNIAQNVEGGLNMLMAANKRQEPLR